MRAGRLRWVVLIVLPAPLYAVTPTHPGAKVIAPPACTQAVAQSRMICLSGSQCQREISAILRACPAAAKSCVEAREELRVYCGTPLPWDGSRQCDGAVRQVAHYCGR